MLLDCLANILTIFPLPEFFPVNFDGALQKKIDCAVFFQEIGKTKN